MRQRLLAQTQLGDQSGVTLSVLGLEVVQQLAATAHHAQQATATVVVFGVGFEVGHQFVDAGRQRMLSQRMAKFYFAAALPVDADKASAEIGKARTEFLAAMDVLRNAPEATPKIKDELQLADGQWFFFDAALQRLQAANRSAKAGSDVFVTSENLLGVMDKVTGLYAAIKT